jgi:hypothetical protein
LKKIVEWFYDAPDGLWIVTILIGSAAAFYEGYAILKTAGL